MMNTSTTKLKRLEKSWNDNVNLPNEVKRITQMSTDIKHFILSSYIDPLEKHRIVEQSQRQRKSFLNTFDKIYDTIEFKHHEGTDKVIEMKVIKIIMMREGLLMTLRFLADKAIKTNFISGAKLLQLLSQIRESTLNYLEALSLWRQSSQQILQPQPFYWERSNYTLKVIHDLDFLSHNIMVTEALSLSPEQLYLNPLMLNNNLEDFNTWMEPYDRAALDTEGRTDDPAFETRLRLRLAERILLQEMEMSDESGVFITQNQQADNASPSPSPSPNPNPGNDNDNDNNRVYNPQSVMVGSSALENGHDYDFAHALSRGTARRPALTLPAHSPHLPTTGFQYEHDGRAQSNDSMNSNRAVSRSDLCSRGSASSFGLSSASASAPAPAPAQTQQPAQQAVHFGHDFFAGHWMENKLEAKSSVFLSRDVAGDLEGGKAAQQRLPDQAPRVQMMARDGIEREGIDALHRSVDSVGQLDVQALRSLAFLPKCLLLAASSCVVLLADGSEVPGDVSWRAFLRLTKRADLARAMNSLDPLLVPKSKALALQPIARQLSQEDVDRELCELGLPLSTRATVAQLAKWVQQLTDSAIQKQLTAKAVKAVKVVKAKVSLTPIKAVAKKGGKPKAELEKARPKAKLPIPKVKLELHPYHTELLEGVLPSPLLLVLLAPGAEGSSLAAADTARLVLKVYDVANSQETMVHVHMREYLLLQEELCLKYSESVRAHGFQPSDLQWWARHAKEVLSVQLRSNGSLHATISKKAIEDVAVRALDSGSQQAPPTKSAATPAPASKASTHQASSRQGESEPVLVSSSLSALPAQGREQCTSSNDNGAACSSIRASIDNAFLGQGAGFAAASFSSSIPEKPPTAPAHLHSGSSGSSPITREQSSAPGSPALRAVDAFDSFISATDGEEILRQAIDPQYELDFEPSSLIESRADAEFDQVEADLVRMSRHIAAPTALTEMVAASASASASASSYGSDFEKGPSVALADNSFEEDAHRDQSGVFELSESVEQALQQVTELAADKAQLKTHGEISDWIQNDVS
jgi:hypothetical protein